MTEEPQAEAPRSSHLGVPGFRWQRRLLLSILWQALDGAHFLLECPSFS